MDGDLRVQGAGVDIAGDEADIVPPAVQITSGPSGSIVERRPTFTFAAEPGATLQCKIDTFFRACSGPTSDTPALSLGPGAHVFEVRATDPTGNQATASRAFTVLPTPTVEIGAVTRNKRRGTAKLSVEVSAAGALALSGKGVKPATGQGVGARDRDAAREAERRHAEETSQDRPGQSDGAQATLISPVAFSLSRLPS